MRHQKIRTRLTQKPAHGRMLVRNLVTSMFLYEKVRTTKKRAEAVIPEIDHLIRYAGTHEPHVAIRYLNAKITDKNASRKVMEVLKDRFAKRHSGLTRMVPAGSRKGDGAQLVDLTFVEGEEVTIEATPKKTSASKKK